MTRAQALKASGAERCCWSGSMSLIALELAPGWRPVSGVALIATSFRELSDALLEATRAAPDAAMDMINVWSHSPSIRAYDRKPSNPGPGFSNIWQNLRLMQRIGQREPAALNADFVACNAYRGGAEAAAALTCPVLFVLGASDQMTPTRNARTLIDACRQPTVVMLEGSGTR
jgi:fermentation-respiration switch protein FrsA (DUF1100 family)